MVHHLRIARIPSVVKIGRVEIGVQQGRRLEQAARADIMLPVIDERSERLMTSGTAQGGVVREALVKSASPCFSDSLIGPVSLPS